MTGQFFRFLALVLLCGLAANQASAHGFRHGYYHGFRPGFSFSFGPGFYRPYYYPYYSPFYSYSPPAIVTVPVSPPVYVERGGSAPSQESGYWYYCNNPEGYYPYVKQCPNGWTKVPPRPQE